MGAKEPREAGELRDYYDREFGKISEWLKEQNLTMHVTLNGNVTFKKRES